MESVSCRRQRLWTRGDSTNSPSNRKHKKKTRLVNRAGGRAGGSTCAAPQYNIICSVARDELQYLRHQLQLLQVYANRILSIGKDNIIMKVRYTGRQEKNLVRSYSCSGRSGLRARFQNYANRSSVRTIRCAGRNIH